MADSALYSKAHLRILAAHRGQWITRVPEMLTLARQQCAEVGEPTALLPGYRYRRVEVDSGGVRQRWLVIHLGACPAAGRPRRGTRASPHQ